MDFSIDELPAVKALGPLFKLTEVNLWDPESNESSYFQESHKLIDGDKDYGKGSPARFNEFASIPEDLQIAKELKDLGLPYSFHTNKEMRHTVTCGKRKSTRKKNQQSHIEFDGNMENTLKPKDVEKNSFRASIYDTSNMLNNNEVSNNGLVAEFVSDVYGLSNLSLENGGLVGSTTCRMSTLSNGHKYFGEVSCLEFDHGGTSEGSCLINKAADCDLKEINGESGSLLDLDHETVGQANKVNESSSSGEWVAYWDDFYKNTYFHNAETGESTWDPPSGMEHLVQGPVDVVDDEAQASCDLSNMVEGLSPDNVFSMCTVKRKKKIRKKPSRKLSVSSEDIQEVWEEVPPIINKYWCQRYTLFSRFDYGIKMDQEGWFSVTPELLAKHHAHRCGNGAIVDFFTGVGGNAIQFAQRSKNVVAIDIDPNKIDYARYNASIYGVDGNIDFIKGDSFSLAPKLKANTVFMSPPWGGPNYSKVKKFDINTMLKPRDGQFLFDAGKSIAPMIVMFLPRNVDINQLAQLALSATPPWSLEVEMNYLNGRLKAVTAYFKEAAV
ncbi:S-adenosyl-L-methionine-dependent methyltransferases superfamily protein [Striga hermonthica]|uniref:Trimethylguanosine synthase n=1 Tax=Striga hermonthica TaxID=68872 RepID=A0A9N7N5D0_STRHE|nr:S-adenosyl-L-methionine-dependent methyltransferases superfamily protein [Striga hermonthica]